MRDRKSGGFFGRLKGKIAEKKEETRIQKEVEVQEEKKETNKIYYIAGAIGVLGTIIILYKTRKK